MILHILQVFNFKIIVIKLKLYLDIWHGERRLDYYL